MIFSSIFSICSAKASALREEVLNFSLNSSNCDNTSGVRILFSFLLLKSDANAPSSPNKPCSSILSIKSFHFSFILSIVFPNIASSLFTVEKIILLICTLWRHTVRLWRTQFYTMWSGIFVLFVL